MKTAHFLVAVLAAVVILGVPSGIQAQPFCVESIGDLIVDDYAILASLLNATGLYDALNSSFTLFAPTNSTLLKTLTALNIDPAVLTSPPALPALTSVLTYHVAANAISLELLKSQPVTTVSTVAGGPLTVNFNPGTASSLSVAAAESTAKILDPQVPGEPALFFNAACNIHIYPIDTVLLPPGATAVLGTLSGVKP